MPKVPRPKNEYSRLKDLLRLEILDSEPEAKFDRVTRVAAEHFRVPIALVSLVDQNRQWFKSKHGLEANETSREISFCTHTILNQGSMIIEDALADSRFADSPLVVGDPHIRFYAGAPLISRNGYPLGTLCLIDSKPGSLDAAQISVLEDLAGIVSDLLESRLSDRALNRELSNAQQQNKLLKQSELQLNTIFESVLDSILILNKDGVVHAHNEAAEKLFGFASAELLGQHARDLMPDTFDKESAEYFENFRAEDRRQIFLGSDRGLEGLRSDGSRFPMELSLSAMQFEGDFFYNVIIRDISKQKAAEIDLLQAKLEAEELSKAKSDFLSRASHELRTPLNSIIGFSDILIQNLTGTISEDEMNYLQLIQNGGRHLASLINEIIEISKIESGKQTFSLESVDIDQLINECWTLMEPQAKSSNLKFNHHIGTGEARFVHGDQQRLKQVILNLLSNAIKYNRKGGSIDIDLSVRTDGTTLLNIVDTGNGIPADKHEAIFNVFERLVEDEYKVEGTGIGLALCKSLVTAMGGSIGVESMPDGGSKFWITLQSATQSEFQPKVKEFQSEKTLLQSIEQDRKILYIEDNPDNMALVGALFEKYEKIELLSANCAAMAYVLAIQHQPDLILLDIHLPDADGFSVLQKLRAMEKTAGIPVLVVSADADRNQQKRFLAAGVEGYITKPIDQTLLLTQIARVFSSVDTATSTN